MRSYEPSCRKKTGPKSVQIFSSPKVPVLQNRVYSNHKDALSAPYGELSILYDKRARFAFNECFDPALLVYDQNYDNSVPSETFYRYYDEIGDYLVEQYHLKSGLVLEVGCGNGVFLSRLADRNKSITGLGIDPSYKGADEKHSGRVNFIKDTIREEYIFDRPDLVLCRHTLEHIPNPVEFLKEILRPLKRYFDIYLFIEVPDLDWILANKAFWDYCYEHCNYFTRHSLKHCVEDAGGACTKISSAFGGQYLWAEAIVNPTENIATNDEFDTQGINEQIIEEFRASIDESFELISKRIRSLPNDHRVVIWGMATKGVIFTLQLLNCGIRFDHCVDINTKKQGCFSPISGYEIVSPESLDRKCIYSIICMNSNYSAEIANHCNQLELKFSLYTPEIELLDP